MGVIVDHGRRIKIVKERRIASPESNGLTYSHTGDLNVFATMPVLFRLSSVYG
jgi:hypothetical protein